MTPRRCGAPHRIGSDISGVRMTTEPANTQAARTLRRGRFRDAVVGRPTDIDDHDAAVRALIRQVQIEQGPAVKTPRWAQ